METHETLSIEENRQEVEQKLLAGTFDEEVRIILESILRSMTPADLKDARLIASPLLTLRGEPSFRAIFTELNEIVSKYGMALHTFPDLGHTLALMGALVCAYASRDAVNSGMTAE